MNTIFIDESALRVMISGSELESEECCGFLLAESGSAHPTITEARVVTNSAKGNRHTNFEISPRDYMNAEGEAERLHLTLAGVYHSHPNHPAIPSACDQAAAQPNFSYVIISVINRKCAEIRSWKMDACAELQEEKIELIFT